MKNQRKFLKCDHCGNMVGIIEDSGVEMVCCGQPMTALVANTTDAAQEKHVPVATREGGRLNVRLVRWRIQCWRSTILPGLLLPRERRPSGRILTGPAVRPLNSVLKKDR